MRCRLTLRGRVSSKRETQRSIIKDVEKWQDPSVPWNVKWHSPFGKQSIPLKTQRRVNI